MELLSFGSVAAASSVVSITLLVLIPLFIFVLTGLLLYYFTGDKKRADEFMPNLMAQSIRIFSYVWMFIASIAVLIGMNMILLPILQEILPEPEFFSFGGDDFDAEPLVQGVLILILTGIFVYGLVMLNRYSSQVSKVYGTISTKLWATIGLVTFSIVGFVSTLLTFTNFVSYLFETDRGMEPIFSSLMISSLVIAGFYLRKVIMVLKSE